MAGMRKKTVRHQWYGGITSRSAARGSADGTTPERRGSGTERNLADRRLLRARSFDVAPEDHLPGRRLENAGDDDVDVLADHPPRVVHDHHRPVVQVGDALVVFLAFLEDEDLHELAGQDHRLERVGELVDVQHLHAAELRDFVEVEVVRDDLALAACGRARSA